MRTRLALVNALAIVLIAVTIWAAYETRRASAAERKAVAAEQKLVNLRGRVQIANAGLKEISRQLNGWAIACQIWPYPAISVTLASGLAASSRALPLLANYQEEAAK